MITSQQPVRSRRRAVASLLLLLLAIGASACGGRTVPSVGAAPRTGEVAPPTSEYVAYVVSEASDQITVVRFGPDGARVDHALRTGMMPTEINGPHGVAVSPDGRHYYVTVAHGTPYGTLWKYTTAGDTLVGRTTLGLYPATVQVTPDNAFAYVANFNVYGEMTPSSVSIVATDEMLEVARVQTCTMPHGSRMNAQGTKHYSACMMDDMIVEIDTRTFAIARHFMVSAGREHGMAGAPGATGMKHGPSAGTAAGGHAGMSHDVAAGAGSATCSPTWAQPSPDGAHVYVACNKSNEILDIDADSWTLARRLPAGAGVYNLAVTPDGSRIVATNKKGRSVSVIDVASGSELARLATKRTVVHGAAISADGRYAFVTVEGVGSEPGTLEIIDLRALATVATVDVGQQAAGVDVVGPVPAGVTGTSGGR